MTPEQAAAALYALIVDRHSGAPDEDDFDECSVDVGLLQEEPYDPDVHGLGWDYLKPGDPFLVSTALAEAVLAAGRAALAAAKTEER